MAEPRGHRTPDFSGSGTLEDARFSGLSEPEYDSDVELDEDEEGFREHGSESDSHFVPRSTERRARPRRRDAEPRSEMLLDGKYRLIRVLKHDGPIAEAEAVHTELGQRVVLQYLTTLAARRPDAVARFLRGARAAAQIQSEYVARVLDVGRFRSGNPFAVVESEDGWPLDEVLRVRGPLPVQEAVEYVLQACEAIAAAHALGITHGGLNLRNLVLTRRSDESPRIKVRNLGITSGADLAASSDGAVRGTPAAFMLSLPYVAPEQIRNPEDSDFRTDVWALAAMLHALIAGTPPFRARSGVALLAAISADEPALLGTIRDDVSQDLEDVVLRCLEKDPELRTESVADLAESLKLYASGDALSSVERVVRLSGRGTRPPPLPVPKTRSIVPVPRPPAPKASAAAAPVASAASPTRSPAWWIATALGGAALGAFGATLPIRAPHGESTELARPSGAPMSEPAAVRGGPTEIVPALLLREDSTLNASSKPLLPANATTSGPTTQTAVLPAPLAVPATPPPIVAGATIPATPLAKRATADATRIPPYPMVPRLAAPSRSDKAVSSAPGQASPSKDLFDDTR